jgi:hypothetical protein
MRPPKFSRRRLLGGLLAALAAGLLPCKPSIQAAAPTALDIVSIPSTCDPFPTEGSFSNATVYIYDFSGRLVAVGPASLGTDWTFDARGRRLGRQDRPT